MAQIPPTFSFPDPNNVTMEELFVVLNRMYTDLADGINSKADVYSRTVDGQTTDTFLPQGAININTTTDKVEILSNHVSPTLVTWTTIS